MQESCPNTYARLDRHVSSTASPTSTAPQYPPPPLPPSKAYVGLASAEDQFYASVNDEEGDDSSERVERGKQLQELASSFACGNEGEVYDYIPVWNDRDDYDYESPYWEPSDKKSELLKQFKKLKIPSVKEKDIQ